MYRRTVIRRNLLTSLHKLVKLLFYMPPIGKEGADHDTAPRKLKLKRIYLMSKLKFTEILQAVRIIILIYSNFKHVE